MVLNFIYFRQAAPKDVEFQLIQSFPTTILTTINVGQRLVFHVIVDFPRGTHTINLELFAPETENQAIFMLCDAGLLSRGRDLIISSPITVKSQNGPENSVWPVRMRLYTYTINDVFLNSSTRI